jgi:hypothetical protein
MTIDSGWVRVLKEECPDAFQPTYPFQNVAGSPKVAYIDGMPLLMISEKTVHSWDDLLKFNYARHIARYFRLGCQAVVLAFDDYERVPMAKVDLSFQSCHSLTLSLSLSLSVCMCALACACMRK